MWGNRDIMWGNQDRELSWKQKRLIFMDSMTDELPDRSRNKETTINEVQDIEGPSSKVMMFDRRSKDKGTQPQKSTSEMGTQTPLIFLTLQSGSYMMFMNDIWK